MEEFNQKLYDIICQSSQNCIVPSFDDLAEKIKTGQSVESFEQFFAGDGTITEAAKPRKFRGRASVAAAAAVLLVLSGILVNTLIHSHSFDSASASAEAVYDEEAAVQATDYFDEAVADSTVCEESGEYSAEDKLAMKEDTTTPASDDCTEAILSGGKLLLIPLDELIET